MWAQALRHPNILAMGSTLAIKSFGLVQSFPSLGSRRKRLMMMCAKLQNIRPTQVCGAFADLSWIWAAVQEPTLHQSYAPDLGWCRLQCNRSQVTTVLVRSWLFGH
eukprot:10704397-Karenia_brevis.AAC.1